MNLIQGMMLIGQGIEAKSWEQVEQGYAMLTGGEIIDVPKPKKPKDESKVTAREEATLSSIRVKAGNDGTMRTGPVNARENTANFVKPLDNEIFVDKELLAEAQQVAEIRDEEKLVVKRQGNDRQKRNCPQCEKEVDVNRFTEKHILHEGKIKLKCPFCHNDWETK